MAQTSDLVLALQNRIVQARAGVAAHVIETPLEVFATAGELIGAEVLIKCEHRQRTGSFKVRGALAKLNQLGAVQRDRGVVAASSGNHGLGVAYALSVLGGNGVVFVPTGASPVKVAAIKRLGVQVRHEGQQMEATEAIARRYGLDHGMTYVSPYNDLDVIAGQGSLGAEIVEQLGADSVDAVVVAVGGGGLAAGVAAAIKTRFPRTRIIGASPTNDAAMAASVRAGEIVSVPAQPTLSDGTAGGIETDAVTFALCAELIDDWVLVSEAEITQALRLVIDNRHELIEGAAAVAVAAVMASAQQLAGQRVLVISCGANIGAAALQAALAETTQPST